MPTNQSNSESHVSLAGKFGGTPPWEMRGRLRNLTNLQMRLPNRETRSSNGRPSSTPVSCSAPPESSRSRIEQLLAGAHEDISRLNEILRTQHCMAVICGAERTILPLNMATIPLRGACGASDAGSGQPPSHTPAFSIPIFDAEGCASASLDIIKPDVVGPDCSEPLLRALAESAARTITERWFRLAHRRHYVIAAMRRNSPRTALFLAADREQRLAGADRHARQMLEKTGLRMGPHIAVSTIFRSNPALLRRCSYGDVSTTLFSSADGEPWVALITPPDPRAIESQWDARALLHVRPRLDSLSHLSSLPWTERAKRGLSHGALQRIEEYIEANLDSDLEIGQLADLVRMSRSHFTRAFHNSVGVTPHRYVIQNRVMRARELLATTNLPLSDIALTTGFSDQSHFSRRFHEIVGIPPGAFRVQDGV